MIGKEPERLASLSPQDRNVQDDTANELSNTASHKPPLLVP